MPKKLNSRQKKIIMLDVKDGVVRIAEKTGQYSYDVLHLGTVNNDECQKRMQILMGGEQAEFSLFRNQTTIAMDMMKEAEK